MRPPLDLVLGNLPLVVLPKRAQDLKTQKGEHMGGLINLTNLDKPEFLNGPVLCIIIIGKAKQRIKIHRATHMKRQN